MPLSWTSDKPQRKQATAKAAWTTFSTDTCSKMLVSVYSYCVMTKNVSCCCVCGFSQVQSHTTIVRCQQLLNFVPKIILTVLCHHHYYIWLQAATHNQMDSTQIYMYIYIYIYIYIASL